MISQIQPTQVDPRPSRGRDWGHYGVGTATDDMAGPFFRGRCSNHLNVGYSWYRNGAHTLPVLAGEFGTAIAFGLILDAVKMPVLCPSWDLIELDPKHVQRGGIPLAYAARVFAERSRGNINKS
jgi:hypothetical protein